MEYSLLFTLYGIIFNIILLVTVLLKKLKKTPKTRVFIFLIIVSMCFAIAEIASIYYFIKTSDFNGYSIIWKIRNAFIVYYVYGFIVYFHLLIKGEKFDTLLKTVTKTPLFLILFIFLTALIVLYILFVGIDPMTPDHLIYVRGIIAIVLVALAIWTAILASYTAIKVRKSNKKVSRCLVIIVILFVCLMPVQLIFNYVSFMPFLTMFLMYVIYHNIENPDIELLEEVTLLKNQIDKSSNAKIDFLFNLSYDLINPMNAIVSLSQSLVTLSTDNKEEIHRDLKSIKYAGNTLLDSIDNILELSETDEQDNKINVKEYGLYELLKRLETVALTRIGAKQIAFELDVADNLNSKYQGDITKIQKSLLNIINNAAKYTDIGKIKLTLTFKPEKEMHMLQFKISDTGCGIKDEAKSFIFSDSQETSGVGLALTKRYIEAMNGTISFDSVYGAGTTFFVNIPQKPIGTKQIAEDKQEDTRSETIEFIDCSKYKALIVDDDELDIKVTTRLIEKYKFQITVITSSIECIDRLKQEEEFDILFLDHKMPELDGMETMKVIKGLEGYKIPKIVALTANAVTGAREYYLKEGFDEYISKPIDIHALDKIIHKTFKQ